MWVSSEITPQGRARLGMLAVRHCSLLLVLACARHVAGAFAGANAAPTGSRLAQSHLLRQPAAQMGNPGALGLDLTGKVAFVAGVADSSGYGWAICKALAETGATVTVGTWPPVLGIFEKSLKTGKFDDEMVLSDGTKMEIAKVYPLDAVFDTPEDIPEDVKSNKRYAGLDGYSISEVAEKVAADYGKIDILVHSLANGPEVTKPLLETSRRGYLAASSASAYSMVSLVQRFGPHMNVGGSALSLTYIAAEKVSTAPRPRRPAEADYKTIAARADAYASPTTHPGDSGLRRRHVLRQGGSRV